MSKLDKAIKETFIEPKSKKAYNTLQKELDKTFDAYDTVRRQMREHEQREHDVKYFVYGWNACLNAMKAGKR